MLRLARQFPPDQFCPDHPSVPLDMGRGRSCLECGRERRARIDANNAKFSPLTAAERMERGMETAMQDGKDAKFSL